MILIKVSPSFFKFTPKKINKAEYVSTFNENII